MKKTLIPIRLREAGCTSMATHTAYRGEIIYTTSDGYYPTIANGYKAAARCSSMAEACKWLDERKHTHGGAREGAGRPKLDRKAVGLRLNAEALAVLERMAEAKGASKSDIVEALLFAESGKETQHGKA